MKVIQKLLNGVALLEPIVFSDERGYFTESYNKQVFKELGYGYDFIQDNHSLSIRAGVIRGLHYQLNDKAQTKLIRVTKGAIYDVIVDIRKGSPSFGEWKGIILTADNKRQLLVPAGFAHGYCTLVDCTEVQYKVDEYYSPKHERCILWNDPTLRIDWPVSQPIVSEKDSKGSSLDDAEIDFSWER